MTPTLRKRANTLTDEERSEIARNAVRARWAKAGKLKEAAEENPKVEEVGQENPEMRDAMPFSMFQGTLTFGNIHLECHVLNNGKRVIAQRQIVKALSGGAETGNLDRYVKANPLADNDLFLEQIIQFRLPSTTLMGNGLEATFLIDLCDKYLMARDQKLLKTSQLGIAKRAEIIVRSCAKVGIIALVDEVTGYQKVRHKNALQIKLQAFIAEELQEWARRFPEEFWLELARLEGVRYSPRSRPLRWGKYIMAFVYDAIDKDVGNKLREKNPNPHYKKNHHMWLKEFGTDKLKAQITAVTTIMKLCRDMNEFRQKFALVFKKSDPTQMSLFDWAEEGSG